MDNLQPGRAVHFQAWISGGISFEAVYTGGRGALIGEWANGETMPDIELETPADAKRLAFALLAMAAEWESAA